MGQSNSFLDGRAFKIISGTTEVLPPTKGTFFRCVVPIGGTTNWKGDTADDITADFACDDFAVGGAYSSDSVGLAPYGADWGTYKAITRISGAPLKAYFW